MGTAVTAGGRAVDAANAFVHAVQWSEHTTLWSLLSESGRTTALSVATSNGLDRAAASRIRDDASDPIALDQFLRRLLGGIRRDFRSVDIVHLETGDVKVADDGGTATVELTNPSAIPGTPPWSAGHLELSVDAHRQWLVDRLVPRLVGP